MHWRDGFLSHRHLDPAVAGDGLRLDLRLVAPEKDEHTPFGPRMLHRDAHEILDQRAKDNLARESL
jgi:hypothetical protein